MKGCQILNVCEPTLWQGRLLFETNAEKYNVDDEGAADKDAYDEVAPAAEAEAAEAAAAAPAEVLAEDAAAVPAAAAAVFLDEGLDDLDDVDFDDE